MRYLYLLTFLLLLVIAPAAAIQVNGTAEIVALTDISGDCGQSPWIYDEYIAAPTSGFYFDVDVANVTATNADRIDIMAPGLINETDWFWVVVFDALGNPIAGRRWNPSVGQIWLQSPGWAVALPFVGGWVTPQAKPFIMKVYDTDGTNPDPDWVWDVIAFGDIAVSAPFDPSNASAACAALPESDPYNFTVQPVPRPEDEDSIGEETGLTPSGTSLAIYTSDGGNQLDFWGVNGDAEGYYLASLSAAEIPVASPLENTLIKSSGDLTVWHLSTGEVQVNWTNAQGKTFVYVFDDIPYSSVYSYVIDPNPEPEATPEVGM